LAHFLNPEKECKYFFFLTKPGRGSGSKKPIVKKCRPLSPLSGGVACLADGSLGNGPPAISHCRQARPLGGLVFFSFLLVSDSCFGWSLRNFLKVFQT
jgi:hypothetical protein